MANHTTTDEITSILAFPFQDEKWVGKIAVGAGIILLSFIPVLNIFSYAVFLGYLAEIVRRIIVDRDEPSLPNWDDLSRFMGQGFSLLGIALVYSLPALLIMGIGYASMFIPVFAAEMSGMSEAEGMGLILFGYLGGFLLFGIGALLSMAAGIVLPAAMCHVVVEEKFSAGFDFKGWWKIFRANWTGFLVSFLILFGGGMLLSYGAYFLVITVILCCLYPIVIGVLGTYLAIVGFALFSKAYRDGVDALSLQTDAEERQTT